MRKKIKSPLVLGGLIVILLSVGVAGAKQLITGKDIKDHSITGKDIKKGSLPLSVLKSPPPAGKQGAKGDPGIVGAPGPKGPDGTSAITEVFSLGGPIEASIAPGSSPVFVGEPAEVTVFAGDQGLVEGTLTLGTTVATINDKAKFAVSICVGDGSEVIPIDEEVGGDFGVSPIIAKDDRVTVTVSSGFFVEGTAGESFSALLGPCVLNETGTALNNNDRAMGYAMVSALG